ncbi:hypothetical protein K2173_006592 [Erythroxylum novogranatense]|uniref:Uncharacterized protein n=1 Tax=Erythroxylum novogranatense TaxID=1862640 RepID=A0AAV8T6V9_9ROSI|nr:hypothetical protein K2173_006592 [Erythroxylum novogranatense]
MEAGDIMELFDTYWFETEILTKPPRSSLSLCSEANPGYPIQEKAQKPELSRVPTLITRSMSEQLHLRTSSGSCFSLSPDSVLCTPKLQTILSGKEITEENEETSLIKPTEGVHAHLPPKKRDTRRKSGKKTMSKSLSELEFEELKGFMDLGFVFSEEDKDSSLVSIIPGLQRLGKRDEEENASVENEFTVTRPYLSEAWEVMERRRNGAARLSSEIEDPLANWRIPDLSSEIDMKDSLKWWAHTVASTVR